MAVNFANVRNIVIPEGTVKTISSGGTQIWGSINFPYRRLEYIHFNGAEYIHLDFKPNYPRNRAVWIKVDSDITTTSARVLGAYDGNATSARRRYYMVVNRGSGFGFAYGDQWAGTLATDHLYDKVLLWTTQASNGTTLSYGVKSPDDVTTYASGTLTASTYISDAVDLAFATNWGAGGTPDTNAMFKGNLYKYVQKIGNGSGDVEKEMYPVQRKSDSVCGMYDIKTDTFYPMEGTTITSAAAGPVEEENYDVTKYRRLECIHFSGAENFWAGITGEPTQGRFYYAQFKFKTSDLPNLTYQEVMGCSSSDEEDNIRFVGLGVYKTSNGVRPFYRYNYSANNIEGLASSSTYLDQSHLYEARWRTYDNNYNQWLCIRDLDTNTDYGYYNDPSSSQQSSQSVNYSHLSLNLMTNITGDIYAFYVRSGGDSGTILRNWVPVQRKSDNVCGMYDTVNNYFLAMTGTNITTAAAGKTLIEYWK